MSDWALGTTVQLCGVGVGYDSGKITQCNVQYRLVLPSGTVIDQIFQAIVLPADPSRDDGDAIVLTSDFSAMISLDQQIAKVIAASIGL